MISIQDAFKKFKNKLELNKKEQKNASKKQKEIRKVLNDKFSVDRDFLTGSYARYTKTKPLKDVDIFCVLGDSEKHYLDKDPNEILDEVKKPLCDKYGEEKVFVQRRSVMVDFGVDINEDMTDYRVVSFDVVPAFQTGDNYLIPDNTLKDWIKTNPEIHAEKAVKAHQNFSNEWKGIVRIVKKWNMKNEKPIKPSFLIEVMALELLVPPYGGQHKYEVQAFFASLADRINEDWDDPAGLGPPISDAMDAHKIKDAIKQLQDAQTQCSEALRLEREGKNGDSLRVWREIFGPLFPIS